MAPAKFCPSFPITLKFSTDVMWHVVLWCPYVGKGAFKYSLNLLLKVLDYSPVYSSSHSILVHFHLCITPFFGDMVSLSFGDTRRFLNVLLPLKCTLMSYSLHVLL